MITYSPADHIELAAENPKRPKPWTAQQCTSSRGSGALGPSELGEQVRATNPTPAGGHILAAQRSDTFDDGLDLFITGIAGRPPRPT